MPKNRPDYDEECALFFAAMQDVRRLKHDKVMPKTRRRHLQTHVRTIGSSTRQAKFHFVDDHTLPSVMQEDYLSFKKPEIADNLLRKLKKGQYNVQSVLDLHGLTAHEAEIELSHFFTECSACSIKVVLLIHGKGKDSVAPVLKNKLNQWLRHYHNVLAFCTALPKHGGTGAVYVLLKSIKEENDF